VLRGIAERGALAPFKNLRRETENCRIVYSSHGWHTRPGRRARPPSKLNRLAT
jgi:hypothetical protein